MLKDLGRHHNALVTFVCLGSLIYIMRTAKGISSKWTGMWVPAIILWQEGIEMAKKTIKSDCILCINSCGITATVEDGKLVKVEGLEEHGVSKGYICPRGEALVEYVYSPERLQYPMKKVDGKWQRISWDEALDTIADKLTRLKEEHGARALAVYSGSLGTENIELAGFAQRFSRHIRYAEPAVGGKAIASVPGSWPDR